MSTPLAVVGMVGAENDGVNQVTPDGCVSA